MARTLTLATITLALAGCAATDTSPTAGGMTLATSRVLPGDAIERRVASADWAILRDLRFEAYVVFDAQVEPDNSVILGRVRKSYPDDTRNEAAKALATKARISIDGVGSHLRPRGEIYVVYFPSSPKGRLALICGKAQGPDGVGGPSGRRLGAYRIMRDPTPMGEPAPQLP